MALYAKLDIVGAFSHTVDLTAETYAALQVNGKAVWLRPWIVDAQPVPTGAQVLVNAGIVVTATEARQTWGLRGKTQAEWESEENEAERVRLRSVITALTGPVDTFGSTAERLAKLEARSLRLERIAIWVLRRFT